MVTCLRSPGAQNPGGFIVCIETEQKQVRHLYDCWALQQNGHYWASDEDFQLGNIGNVSERESEHSKECPCRQEKEYE